MNFLRALIDVSRRGENDMGPFDWNVPADYEVKLLPPKKFDTEMIWKHLKSKNLVRAYRVKSDYRWMQRELKKLGLNPEDARWLL